MLFPNALHDGLRDGSVTLTVRRWSRPQAKVGGRYRSGGGLLEATAVERVPAHTITDDDARRCGSADRSALFAAIGVASEDDLVYRIELRRVGEVPVDPLPLDTDLSDDDVADLTRRLDRMGEWAIEALRLIEAHPARRAGDLADLAGRDRLPFKADVRKLKRLGLTQSLEVGYRLSPRGEAYLRRRASPASPVGRTVELGREGRRIGDGEQAREAATDVGGAGRPVGPQGRVVGLAPGEDGVGEEA